MKPILKLKKGTGAAVIYLAPEREVKNLGKKAIIFYPPPEGVLPHENSGNGGKKVAKLVKAPHKEQKP